jgi:hypothetical protein
MRSENFLVEAPLQCGDLVNGIAGHLAEQTRFYC